MDIILTPELQTFVEQKLASGQYASTSEIIQEALYLLREKDHLREWRLEELRREIDLGLDDLENGRVSTYTENTLAEIEAEGLKRLAAYKAKKEVA